MKICSWSTCFALFLFFTSGASFAQRTLVHFVPDTYEELYSEAEARVKLAKDLPYTREQIQVLVIDTYLASQISSAEKVFLENTNYLVQNHFTKLYTPTEKLNCNMREYDTNHYWLMLLGHVENSTEAYKEFQKAFSFYEELIAQKELADKNAAVKLKALKLERAHHVMKIFLEDEGLANLQTSLIETDFLADIRSFNQRLSSYRQNNCR